MHAATPEDAIQELAALFPDNAIAGGRDKLETAAIEREREASTWLGKGLALPHARTYAVSNIVAAVGRSDVGIPWGPNGEQAQIIVLVGVPKPQVRGYLELVRRLIAIFRDESRVRAWLDAADPEVVRAEWSRAMQG